MSEIFINDRNNHQTFRKILNSRKLINKIWIEEINFIKIIKQQISFKTQLINTAKFTWATRSTSDEIRFLVESGWYMLVELRPLSRRGGDVSNASEELFWRVMLVLESRLRPATGEAQAKPEAASAHSSSELITCASFFCWSLLEGEGTCEGQLSELPLASLLFDHAGSLDFDFSADDP